MRHVQQRSWSWISSPYMQLFSLTFAIWIKAFFSFWYRIKTEFGAMSNPIVPHTIHKQELITPKNNVSLSQIPLTDTETSYKQQKYLWAGHRSTWKAPPQTSPFNRQNVQHNAVSWPFSSSVISKCMLSRALLLHTIEKSLGGLVVAAVSQDYTSDSFAAEVKHTKINTNILLPRSTFSPNEKAEWTKGRALPSTTSSGSAGRSLCFWKAIQPK